MTNDKETTVTIQKISYLDTKDPEGKEQEFLVLEGHFVGNRHQGQILIKSNPRAPKRAAFSNHPEARFATVPGVELKFDVIAMLTTVEPAVLIFAEFHRASEVLEWALLSKALDGAIWHNK